MPIIFKTCCPFGLTVIRDIARSFRNFLFEANPIRMFIPGDKKKKQVDQILKTLCEQNPGYQYTVKKIYSKTNGIHWQVKKVKKNTPLHDKTVLIGRTG